MKSVAEKDPRPVTVGDTPRRHAPQTIAEAMGDPVVALQDAEEAMEHAVRILRHSAGAGDDGT